MHEEPPKNEEIASEKNETPQAAEVLPLEEQLEEKEKDKIFEDAKKHGAWFPIAEGLRVGVSKSKLILYAEEVLAGKFKAGDADGLNKFKGALERNGFKVSQDQEGKYLVNISYGPESPEEQFEKAVLNDPIGAIKIGLKLGVLSERIEEFAKTSMAEEINHGNYLKAINILKTADVGGLNMGTSEEIEAVTTGLYEKCLEEKKYHAAMEITRMKWGIESEQYKKALEAYEEDPENKAMREAEEKRERELENWSAEISKDATFKELFDAIDEGDEDLRQSDIFMGRVWYNFDQEISNEILELLDDVKAANTGVIAFFKKHGYSKSDIETSLPIKFKRERRKKENKSD